MGFDSGDFSSGNRANHTHDNSNDGRWIAGDESAYHGEQLLNGPRYLVYATVAIDDSTAAPVVDELRRRSRVALEVAELKFKYFKRNTRRLELLKDLWGNEGPLAGRCAVAVIDSEFVVCAKMVDLLLEEQEYSQGRDLYAGGEARGLASTLAREGRRALGDAGYRRLLDAFIACASQRGVGNEPETVGRFFEELDQAWGRSTRRNVSDVLFRLRSTRLYADNLHMRPTFVWHLEMLAPCIAQTARVWAKRLGTPVSFLADDHKFLTDEALSILGAQLRTTWGATPSTVVHGIDLRNLVHGRSHHHASIQLADLLAGAAGAVANSAPQKKDQVASELENSVIPLMIEESLAT